MENIVDNTTSTDKDLTISEKAEQSVLSSILMDNDAITTVASILKQNDFYYTAHQLIYSVMLELYKEAIPIDYVTLVEKIRLVANIEDVGGNKYIATLPSMYDYSKNVEYYAKIVKEKSKLRQLIHACNSIIATASSGRSAESVLNIAEKTMVDISNQGDNTKNLRHMQDLMVSVYEMMDENYKKKGKLTGMDTGFADINYYTNGFQKTDMVVVGARPGIGKTAFALNLANNVSKTGAKVAIFSLEMSDVQLGLRLVAAESRIELTKIKTSKLEEDGWIKVIDAISVLRKRNMYTNQTPEITLSEIRTQCRKLKMQQGLDMIVIDYIQLMQSDNDKNMNREQEVAEISRGLKLLAKELNCTVVALSQLNRGSERTKEKRPMLSDLRESGSIEQDADIVMLLYRDDSPEAEKKNVTEVIIAKNRSGETGLVELVWLGEYQLLLDLAHE